jgi:hypothetical protein
MNNLIVFITEGEYSDYNIKGHYRILKKFNFREAIQAFKELDKEKVESSKEWNFMYDSKDRFVATLLKEGFIEEVEIDEIHIGSYSRLETSQEAGDKTYEPSN